MESQIQDTFRTNVATGERTVVDAGEPPATTAAQNDERSALFAAEEARNLRSRWNQIQTDFVDEPRKSVKEADDLVGTVVDRLTEMFADQRSKLEREWDKGGDVSTEELRMAFRRYRALFDRLLSV